MTVTRICAWCKKELGESSSSEEQQVITHGICDECALNLRAQMGIPLQEYLDGLKAPVLLVDSDVKVLTANAAVRGLIGKELDYIEGFKGGDVFECAFARLPGGCGKTVHCSGCAIRRTVMDTFRTGESHVRTPAYLNQQVLSETRCLDLSITTEKVGDVVLLRIDRIDIPAEK
jgi:hypothetical protein